LGIQDALALALLQGDFGEGDAVPVDLRGEALTFERGPALALAA
jgi:hypothetical protein